MTTIYTQGENGLVEYGNVTYDKIVEALGFVPADASKVEAISEADNKVKYVTDKDGNIITKTDAEGFHAAAMTVNGKDVESGLVTETDRTSWDGKSDLDDVISKEDDKVYYIVDKDGNILLKVGGDGVDAAQYKANGTVMKCIVAAENGKLLFSDGTEIDVAADGAGSLYSHYIQLDRSVLLYDIEFMFINNSPDAITTWTELCSALKGRGLLPVTTRQSNRLWVSIEYGTDTTLYAGYRDVDSKFQVEVLEATNGTANRTIVDTVTSL